MIGERFEIDGRVVEVVSEKLVTTYGKRADGTEFEMQYTAVTVQAVREESE